MSPAKAFVTIVRNEMGFRAKYLHIDDIELTVETHVFGDVDVTTVKGSVEDLAPLIRVARHHCSYGDDRAGSPQVIKARDSEFEKAANALYANIKNGTGTIRSVLITLLHEDFGLDLSVLGAMNLDDLVAAAELGWYEKSTPEEMALLVA